MSVCKSGSAADVEVHVVEVDAEIVTSDGCIKLNQCGRRSTTGIVIAEYKLLAISGGIAGAFILGVASYVLEPYRRVLLGVSGGILFGFSVSTAFGLDGWFGGFLADVLAFACGAVGGLLVPRLFECLSSVHLPLMVQPW